MNGEIEVIKKENWKRGKKERKKETKKERKKERDRKREMEYRAGCVYKVRERISKGEYNIINILDKALSLTTIQHFLLLLSDSQLSFLG